jgi:hypothetical protein
VRRLFFSALPLHLSILEYLVTPWPTSLNQNLNRFEALPAASDQ